MTVPSAALADLIASEQLRTRIEAAVARLIDALDAIDAPAEDMEDAHDREEENEHGGDILDEPHDDNELDEDGDAEPSLGWPEHLKQGLAARWDASGGMDVEDVNGVDRLTWETTHA